MNATICNAPQSHRFGLFAGFEQNGCFFGQQFGFHFRVFGLTDLRFQVIQFGIGGIYVGRMRNAVSDILQIFDHFQISVCLFRAIGVGGAFATTEGRDQ